MDPAKQPSAPEWNTDMKAIEQIFGNRARNDIIRVLAVSDQMTYGDLREQVGIRDSTLHRHLRALEEYGVIAADLPPGQRQGRGVRYSIRRARVEALGQAWMRYLLGESSE
ncbi:transcriptional regulator [Cryobacterium cheniae]|uniref:Transcriptional regulator n=2 Tax=Cryobacterium TaxID=69578 RepID=A0A4R8XSI5_9MICO|nr:MULTISPECIES: helix-turn-helix transcriptional regulator [Cryobacterium]TFC82075.1 transcriptional regulator [Cryobacterium cheniae]TFD02721.1 transcriptional regulator [Cryobacterium sinapicolor]